MSDLERIQNELKNLGYDPFIIDSPQGQAVIINYVIGIGKYTGQSVLLGFSFQEGGYPEYPPHWIHISPPYNDELGGSQTTRKFPDNQGKEREWLSLSRPPTELWDNLPTKHMQHFLNFHITRFCKNLK